MTYPSLRPPACSETYTPRVRIWGCTRVEAKCEIKKKSRMVETGFYNSSDATAPYSKAVPWQVFGFKLHASALAAGQGHNSNNAGSKEENSFAGRGREKALNPKP